MNFIRAHHQRKFANTGVGLMATAKMSLKKKRPCTSPTLPPGAQTVQVHESGREERNKMNSSSNCLSRYDGRVRSYSGGFDDVGAALGLDIGGSLSKMVYLNLLKQAIWD